MPIYNICAKVCLAVSPKSYSDAYIYGNLRFSRVSDAVNYGDESEALGLVNPSIYSQKGVYETDFFAARHRDEVRNTKYRVLFT